MIYFLKFFSLGILNTIFGYTVIFTLFYFGFSDVASSFIGYASGLAVSFYFSKKYIFKVRGDNLILFLRFFSVFITAFLVNLLVLKVLMYAGLNFYISQVVASAAYFMIFFFASKKWAFEIPGQLK